MPSETDFAALMDTFDVICDRPAHEQERRLAALRPDGPRWLPELERMLLADGEPDVLAPEGFADLARSAVQDLAAELTEGAPAAASAGDLIDGRYRVQALLGQGATSEVFSATDTKNGEFVAIKLLRKDASRARLQSRFEREYRAIARLDHPGVLRVFALGDWEGHRYIAMELVDGDLRALAGAELSVLVPVLASLCDALDYVHRQGIVHRDLKPENVLIEPNSARPRLADFGVIRLLGQDTTGSTVDGAIVGSVDYLSPEQVNGTPVDPRSDLYSLGCMIFDLVTGRVPFEGNVFERLHRRVTDDAPSLAYFAPDAPPQLIRLVDALLRREPTERPPSAWNVALELRELVEERLDAGATGGRAVASHGAWLFGSGCVGRAPELAALLDHASASRERTGLSLLVAPPGYGKTTLCSLAEHKLRAAGWAVVTARLEQDDRTPFAPLVSIARAGFDEPTAAAPAPLPLLELHRNPFGDEGRGKNLKHLAEQLVDELRNRARGRPVALVLEDMHYAGADALRLVAALAHEIDASRSLDGWVLLTSRTHAEARLREAFPGGAVCVLKALDDAAVGAMVARVLGTAAEEIPPLALERVVQHAHGSPLFAVSAVRAMVASGALMRARRGWSSGPALEDLDLDAAISTILEKRAEAVGPAARELLAVAALFGNPLDADLLRVVTGVDAESVDLAIDEGIRAGVLSAARNGDVHFEHALIAEAFVASLGEDERARLHDGAAAALLARGGTGPDYAWHATRGSDRALAVDAAERAAEVALRVHDYALAATFLSAALKRADLGDPGESPAQVSELRERLADALVPLGEVDNAITRYGALEAERPDDTLRRVRLMRKRGLAMLRTEASGAAVDLLRAALRLAGGGIPGSRWLQVLATARDFVWAQARRLFPRRQGSPLAIERAIVQRELALLHRWIDLYQSAAYVAGFTKLAEQCGPAEFRVDAYGFDSFFFAILGNAGLSRHFERKGTELARRESDKFGLMRLELTRGGTDLLVHGDVTSSQAHMGAGVALAEQLCDDFSLAFACLSRGWSYALVGEMSAAVDALDTAERHGRRARATWVVADTVLLRAYVASVHGDVAYGRAAAQEILNSDLRLAFPVFDALANEVIAGCALLEGHLHEAVTTYERAKSIYRTSGLDRGWGLLVSMSHIEALCALADEVGDDQVPDFEARLKDSVRWTKRWLRGRRLYAGCYEMTLGVLASRRGEVARAHTLFERVRHIRAGAQPTYIDTWLRARMALERRRWSAAVSPDVEAELDAVELAYEEWGMFGMQRWLVRHRQVVNSRPAASRP